MLGACLTGARGAAVTDTIDHAVGIADLIKFDQPVAPGTRLCMLHVNDAGKGARAEALLRKANRFSATALQPDQLVQDLIT